MVNTCMVKTLKPQNSVNNNTAIKDTVNKNTVNKYTCTSPITFILNKGI